MSNSSPSTVQWSSRLAYIMAASGAAVGLGNIWRFPYIAGQNGGGAFVLVYILFVIVLGIPVVMGEVLIGRRGRQNPAFAFRNIAKKEGRSKWWLLAGALPALTGFLILSYYSVITGWVLDFFVHSIAETFKGISIEQTSHLFETLLNNPMRMLFWDTLMIAAIILIIGRGIQKGLERTVYFMFPALMILIIVLLVYAIKTGSFMQGAEFLFKPDFSKLTADSILVALGQAFFSLSIGTGAMIAYGKYVTKETSITSSTMIIAATDTFVALIAGLAIFPIVFANGLEPGAGPSLIFKTLPIAFGQMPGGDFFAGLFFLMLLFAAFTSAIALFEPMVIWCMEGFNWSRMRATSTCGFVLWILSLGTIGSFNIANDLKISGMTFFDGLDHITSNIFLPLSGLLVAIFTGWMMTRSDTADELQLNSRSLTFRSWRFVMRYVAPIAIVVIFLRAVNIV